MVHELAEHIFKNCIPNAQGSEEILKLHGLDYSKLNNFVTVRAKGTHAETLVDLCKKHGFSVNEMKTLSGEQYPRDTFEIKQGKASPGAWTEFRLRLMHHELEGKIRHLKETYSERHSELHGLLKASKKQIDELGRK